MKIRDIDSNSSIFNTSRTTDKKVFGNQNSSFSQSFGQAQQDNRDEHMKKALILLLLVCCAFFTACSNPETPGQGLSGVQQSSPDSSSGNSSSSQSGVWTPPSKMD